MINKRRPVIYEVNLRQYSKDGSFNSFMEHLPRLKGMGVDVLWFMPIFPIGITNRKGVLGSYYSISNFYDVNSEFGTLNDFKLLVDEAHHLGLKVVIDWVANHTAWDHSWVEQWPEFYELNNDGKMYAPYDWQDVAQLNHKNETQQNAMVAAMQFWVEECRVDGFRCDMAHLTPLETWRKAKAVCEKRKHLLWLAETEDENYFEVFDIIYGWEWLHACNEYVKQERIDRLKQVIDKYFKSYTKGKYRLMFTTNHDENSWSGSEYTRLGNRAILFTLLGWLLPGVPLMYSGQESAFKKSLAFFEKDDIDWGSFENEELFTALLEIIHLHKPFNNEVESAFDWVVNNNKEKVLSFKYKNGIHRKVILVNLSTKQELVKLMDNKIWGKYKVIFDSSNFEKDKLDFDNHTDATKFSILESMELKPLQLIIAGANSLEII